MLNALKVFAARLRVLRSRIGESVAEFAQLEAAGSMVLLAATVLALIAANSVAATWWQDLWHIEIAARVGMAELAQSALHWVNDGLMVLFFFVVGLEIKREIIVGELSTPRKAILPIIAAAGGMLVPAMIYALMNRGTPTVGGWGIPMATDIAFALGVIALLGDRVPASLKVFVAAFAIADDIGAVLIIALFYTAEVFPVWLAVGAALLLVLLLLNRTGVDSPVPYLAIAVIVWFCFLNSGIHTTVAGVLVALTIPVKARMAPMAFVGWARAKVDEIETFHVPGAHVLESPDQQRCAWELQAQARRIQAPLQRMEHVLHPVSTFAVLPLFALANAGVALGSGGIGAHTSPVSLGVFLGLVLGKPLGIVLFTWLATRLRLADLPEGATWRHILGAGCLGGVGFTMSLFISALAFGPGELQESAKLAILVSSVVAGVIGYVVLRGSGAQGATSAVTETEDM